MPESSAANLPAEPIPGAETVEPGAPAAPAAPEGEKTDAVPGDMPASDEGGEQKPKTALEAVQQAVDKQRKPPAKEAAPASDKPNQEKPAEGKPEKQLSEAAKQVLEQSKELKDTFHMLQRENRELKVYRVAQVKNESVIKELTPKAQTHDELHHFLSQSNLSQDDFSVAMQLAATIRNDPAKGFEQLMGIVQQLAPAVGAVLPADLQQMVTDGKVDPAVAERLAKESAGRKLAEARWAEDKQRREAEDRARQERDSVAAEQQIVDAVTAWGVSVASRDPDWAKKEPLVSNTIKAMLAEGYPESPKAAVEMAEDALEKVNTYLRNFAPPPKPMSGQTLPKGSPSSTQAPVPKSALEAAQLALASRQ